MKLYDNLSDCCGCSACKSVCPVNAISMEANEEGFLYPIINHEKCISCGQCVAVCSFHDSYTRSDTPLEQSEFYAVIHKEERMRKTSRSGGAFAAFAQYFLENDGAVYGVALDENYEAFTCRVTSAEELPALQGSKYVQSNKRNSFVQVKEDLEQGRSVFFSGTSCEVSGLLSFLNKKKVNTENLLTCDIVCHGVPSPLIWKENMQQIEKRMGGKVEHISFRDKRFGWAPHIESYQKGNKTLFANKYTALFYSHRILRPSCFACHFCNYERVGDITIADFWGVEQLNLPIDISRGVSLLMVHTENGKRILNQLSDNIDIFSTEKQHTFQPNLASPSKASPDREHFWNDYSILGYKKASLKHYKLIEHIKLAFNILFRKS